MPTRFIGFISSKTSHTCFLSALRRLEDVLSVALHLDCLPKLVCGIEPAVVGVVAILLAHRTRDDGLGHISFAVLVRLSPFAMASSTVSRMRGGSSSSSYERSHMSELSFECQHLRGVVIKFEFPGTRSVVLVSIILTP